jgi:hypothetical protein
VAFWAWSEQTDGIFPRKPPVYALALDFPARRPRPRADPAWRFGPDTGVPPGVLPGKPLIYALSAGNLRYSRPNMPPNRSGVAKNR